MTYCHISGDPHAPCTSTTTGTSFMTLSIACSGREATALDVLPEQGSGGHEESFPDTEPGERRSALANLS